ncbi:MAG TPA: hypothetical protein VGW38_06200 [Chloroflexota bacterium]|nr:hypothetical protein [Chloroflexota bacterium]
MEFVKEVVSDFRPTGRRELLQPYPELAGEEMPPLPPGFVPVER